MAKTSANNVAAATSQSTLRSRPRGQRILLLALVLSIFLASTNAAMQDFLGKKYQLSDSKNFDEFMQAIGVGFITRKIASATSPSVEVTEKDGKYTMKTTSTFKNQVLEFVPGVEFEEETPDDRKVKSTITFEGNKMIHVQKGDKLVTIEREFGPEKMTAVMKVDDIVCTRTYDLEK
ncbi:fatty acid-binding protein, liver [Copidosoma floridanum]|uniref:fatty acid-binding protein, liver n=1 Tax=Copidosoma floridanum TaxID=29053 RepID=UPI0006C9730D|nr:fatty acid-binding protein, liver [Copidosoma floridanum]